jgi:hypothetical protein
MTHKGTNDKHSQSNIFQTHSFSSWLPWLVLNEYSYKSYECKCEPPRPGHSCMHCFCIRTGSTLRNCISTERHTKVLLFDSAQPFVLRFVGQKHEIRSVHTAGAIDRAASKHAFIQTTNQQYCSAFALNARGPATRGIVLRAVMDHQHLEDEAILFNMPPLAAKLYITGLPAHITRAHLYQHLTDSYGPVYYLVS